MEIEEEALYGLFETLYLPPNGEAKTVENEPITADTEAVVTNENNPVKTGIFLLFDHELSTDEREFLFKILSAIQILPEQVEMIYNGHSDMVLDFIKGINGKLILWGIPFNNINKYEPKQGKSVLLIIADKLTEIQNNQTLKTQLWNCLKAVFAKK